jgi:hypothetical protein
MKNEKQGLAEELQRRINSSRAKANSNYYAAYTFIGISVGSSVITALSVAKEWLPKEVNVVLAALPAAAVAITNTCKFEARSDWWWEKFHKLDGLRLALLNEGKPIKDVSQEMRDFLDKHQEKWPGFGKPPPK